LQTEEEQKKKEIIIRIWIVYPTTRENLLYWAEMWVCAELDRSQPPDRRMGGQEEEE